MNPQRPIRKLFVVALVSLLACSVLAVIPAMAAPSEAQTRHTFRPAAEAPRPASEAPRPATLLRRGADSEPPVATPGTPAPAPTSALAFFTVVPPCRVFDTRQPADAPPLLTQVARTIQITGKCGVPANAKSVTLNVTVTNAGAAGFVQIYPGDGPRPSTSTINFPAHVTRATNTFAQLASDGSLDAFYFTPAPGKTVDLILDVTGYFADATPIAVDDPSAGDTSYTTTLNTPLAHPAPGVLANDTTNGASIVSYGATTGTEQTTIGTATPTAQGGTITLNADGSFNYTPPTGFKGDDTFKYVIQNVSGSAMAMVTISVGKGNQTITFTSTPPSPAKVGGTYVVTATASPSGLPVALSIDATSTSICSLSGSASGSTVTFNAVGTCLIDANQAGDSNYNPAPQVQQPVTVVKGDQTITFTSTPPSPAKVGGTYVVTATASSGLAVTLSIDASATAVCSISGSASGSTVTFNTVGTCVIDANQAGDANWNAAPQAQQNPAVQKGDQTITFTSTPPSPAKVNGTYVVTATASSGLPVTLSIDASATSVCSISGSTSGSTVTFNAVGNCLIDANQAGDTNWNAAPQAQQSVGVGKADQTITFTSTPPSPSKVGGTYIVTATASSGLPVTLSIDATATSICSISGSTSGSTVTFNAVGTCVIDANQAGDANYNAAPQAQQSDPVVKGDQTITFTSTPPSPSKVGGTYIVTATASSGLPVTLSIDASATAVCSISGSTSGSTVTFNAVGTCVIDANQAGNANYNAAPQAQQSDPVAKGDQVITFTSTPPSPSKVGGTYIVTATASSGLPVTLSIDASATAVCSISGSTSGSTVTFNAVGTCVIDANQAGNANWNPAPQAQQSDPVAKGDQTITFTSTPPSPSKVGGTYIVTATASSGLPVTLSIDATATAVCSISGSTSGSTVTFNAVGTCVIDANQAGDANWNPASQVQQSDPVAKGDQTITFTSTAPVNAKVGGPGYVVTATASSGLPVTLSIDASATSICTISGSTSGSTVSFIGAGTCVIDANQAGNANYNAAPQAQQSVPVAKGDQTITFTSTAPAGAQVGGPTYTVTATASSGLPVTLSIDASATSICTISGSTSGSSVSFIGAGTCVIDANQAGNVNYNAATQVQQIFLVAKGNQTITFTSTAPVNAHVGNTYIVTATASSGLPVTLSIDASATSICSISGSTSGSTVTFTAIGTCVIDANQPGNVNWNAAPQVQQTVQVINTPPTPIANPKESFQTVGNTAFDFRPAQVSNPGIFVSGKLLDNFQPDPDGPSPLSVTLGTASAGAIVTIDSSTGAFTYIPPAGKTGSDTFTYVVSDGMDSVTRTVTINFVSRVWYVKNNATAGGMGRSNDPFDTLAGAQGASAANDYIFVYGGDGTTTGQAAGITLQANQKLYGEAFGLTISGTVNGVTNPTLVAANTGNRPKIDNTAAGGNAVAISNVTGTEVRGLSIAANTNAVNVTSSGSGSAGATITNNVITGSGAQAIKVVIGGTGTSSSVTIQNNSISATGNGIDTSATGGPLQLAISNNANILSGANGILVASSGSGSTTITSFNDNSIHQNTVGTGISITNATFDSAPGTAGFQTVYAGNTAVGVSGDGVGGAGIVLANVQGDLRFGDAANAGSLNVFASNGAGLQVSGTGAGFQIQVQPAPSGSSIIEATGGPAVSVTSATVDLQLTSLKSTSSASTGVNLDTVGGTFSTSNLGTSAITNATGTSFNVNAGNAAVTYGGTITSSAGRVVSVTSTTGGTKSFSGTINGTGQGIFLNSNTGATINFSGQLTLSTGANDAFTATGGGTVTATNTASTVATTTGKAVNIANTTIGASGVKFKSVSAGTAASGPANGIVLNNTGTTGGLTVIGTGSAGSGGTIQKTTGHGISITSAANISLSWMNVTNPGTDGVNLSNTAGTNAIANCSITGSPHQGITVDNNNTNMSSFSLTGTTVSGTTGGDGMLMAMRGTSVLTTGTISGNTFSSNSATGLQVNNADTGNISSLTVQNNTVSGNNAGMDFDLSQASSMTIVVQSNTITNSHTQALNLVTATSATGGSMTATLRTNNIGTAGVNDSGSAIGNGIRVANGGLNISLTIDGNVIREVPNGRGISIEAQAYIPNLNLKAKIINNQIVRPSGTNQNIGCGANVPCPSASIFVLSDSNGLGGFDHVCTVITGNSAYDPTSWPAGGEAAFYFARRTSASNTLSLEGTQANVTTQIQSTNTITNLTSAGVVDENTSGTVAIVPANTCGGFPP